MLDDFWAVEESVGAVLGGRGSRNVGRAGCSG